MKTKATTIKILYVKNGDFLNGGIEMFIRNNFQFLISRGFEIDFLIYRSSVNQNGFDENNDLRYYKSVGSNIFITTNRRENLIKNIIDTNQILRKGNYDIVHAHMGASSFITLLQAKLAKVKCRIAHSHGSANYYSKNFFKRSYINFFLNIFKYFLPIVATDFLACSKYAGDFLFGKHSYTVINNGIYTEKFKFNLKDRECIRKKLEISNEAILLVHIARFDKNKNQKFSIELLKELERYNKYHLLFIGNGELLKECKNITNSYSLKNVTFISETNEVHKYLSAADIMLLPSYSEGFPLTVIESQTNGLLSFLSDTISSEVNITGLVNFFPLEEKIEWINQIINMTNSRIPRENYAKVMYNAGYDIHINSDYMISFYMQRRETD